ncbi:hypothetical protein OWR29_33040 [Actinoplanes sp. Pm04-4]|uniref:ResB-like domain-containing protein n=1 Tax=Paractinoplanes pyxinae TaxID=2997416 RepID=A0ABT4B8P6_9ACTN|nr:hypothetical protein [Actinoplanes pyxinae]MCY1142846.1 hypothetical protein [Actinoplanes pyxinae]
MLNNPYIAAAASALLGFGQAVAVWCGRLIEETFRQWRMTLFLVVGVACAVTTVALRNLDAGEALPVSTALDRAQIGVFTNVDSRVVFGMTPTVKGAAAGVQVQPYRFFVNVKPGPRAYGRIGLVLLDGGPTLWKLSVDRPLTLFFELPEGADLTEWQNRGVVVEPPMEHPCASWWDGKDRGEAPATLQRSGLGITQVTCRIPKVGDVSDLRIDLQFAWGDDLRRSAGFDRVSSSIRLADHIRSPSDVEQPSELTLVDKVDLRLLLDTEERLAESFPEPSGGSHNERSWQYDNGGDLDYIIERPGARTWVQPTLDGLLLMAGAMFGIAPTAWRRRRSDLGTA